jgi:hypothetical protein
MGDKRYMLHPGYVFSQTDGDRHWVSADRLADLYGVPMGQCCIERCPTDGLRRGGLIHLTPRTDGDYTLPNRPGGEE